MKFYLVENGVVSEATPDTEFDGIECVLVAAESEALALELADQYDKGMIGIDNVWLRDECRAVAAIIARR